MGKEGRQGGGQKGGEYEGKGWCRWGKDRKEDQGKRYLH